jgi:hypothetical protein
MRTEIYIDNYRLDLTKDISAEFTYAIDEIQDFASRNTSFSKTIVLPGNDTNNKLFGNIFDFGNSNLYNPAIPNVGYNFNATKSVPCIILVDKIQIFKGVLRLLEIIIDDRSIEYEVAVFGELGGFINALGNNKLEDIDFGIADQTWNATTIANSWDNISGTGVYYPLIDNGNVSTNKIDFSFDAFRPALFVKQYLTKILDGSGYTYDFPLLSTSLMNRLVIPHNQKTLTKNATTQFIATPNNTNYAIASKVEFTASQLGPFLVNVGNNTFTYNSATTTTINFQVVVSGAIIDPNTTFFNIALRKNGVDIASQSYVPNTFDYIFTADLSVNNISVSNTDFFDIFVISDAGGGLGYDITGDTILVGTDVTSQVDISYGDTIVINDTIPKGIFQKDFFASIVKMFNLYVYEDRLVEKKLIIKPFIDFYDGSQIDWTGKVDRGSVIRLKPMSEFTARYYDYKYKQDNDFYAENYRKKYNEGYGDFIYDSENEFVKEVDSTELIFASTILYQLTATDKIYSTIYKLSNENTKEDKMDSVIRILQAKKVTGMTSWKLTHPSGHDTYTAYGYAGHVDDPLNPTNDINWGAPKELFFTTLSYTAANLFNGYWSEYIAEITDKDSKLLTCSLKLNEVDIYNLDFSKLIYIDGSLWRLNKVLDYNPMDFNVTKVELLKVIELNYI